MLAVIGTYLMTSQRKRESPEEHARRLERTYGISVAFDDLTAIHTQPHQQPLASDSIEVMPAERDAAAIALGAIERSLAQYPAGFVRKLIRAIYVCGELRMDGAEAGGTAGTSWILLAAPRRLGVSGIEQTSWVGVHHELSSIVYQRDPAIPARWSAFAPKDARFQLRADEVLARARDQAPALSTGFLSAYGATNPENDFNVYAEEIFTQPAKVRAAAAAEPLVKRKLDFVLRAYEVIDPAMRQVFEQLGVKF